MTLRRIVLPLIAALAAPACYLSHADRTDASSDRPEAARDADAPPPDDAAAHDDAAADDGGGGPCPGEDILDASELIERRAEFDGRVVYVRGTVVEYGPRRCTAGPCFPETPCCNECSVPVMLAGADGNGPVIQGTGAGMPGCYGDDCHLVCTPYDVGRRYVLRGTFLLAPSDPGALLVVMGAPGDVCEESPPPDHRGSYRVRAKRSSLEGDCDRWAPVVGSSGFLFVSVGDPGELQMWQALAVPPGPGRFEGTIVPGVGSHAAVDAMISWSCCGYVLFGALPDNRAIEVTLRLHEEGSPACSGSFELVGMRANVPCADTYDPDACFGAGGIYAFVGPETGEICSCPTFDGHRTCVRDTDCEQACLAEIPEAGCSSAPSGHCSKGHEWSGCYCWFETGPTDYATCWD